MLTFTINGRLALAVRALRFVTEGTYDAASVVSLFYDPEGNSGDGASAPSSFQLTPEDRVNSVSPTRWNPIRIRVEAAGTNSSAADAALPAGVFVWADEFTTYYSFLRNDRGFEDLGYQAPPAGQWGWNEDPQLSASESEWVWEGFERYRPAKMQTPRAERKNSRRQLHEALMLEIDEIIATAQGVGITASKTAMPGQKIDLIDILQHRNSARAGRADSTYEADFKEMGLRWTGGKNRADRTRFLACFGLLPRAI